MVTEILQIPVRPVYDDTQLSSPSPPFVSETSMSPTEDEQAAFHRDGYVIVENLMSPAETTRLRDIARADKSMAESAYGREDADGAVVTLALRNELRETLYSAIARSRRIVDRMTRYLGDEVYHYHHKLILKEPRVGGAWEWHQDYGYWYNNGCLTPDMGSCLIAIDEATRENGCLQVLKGSHHIGRIDHGQTGDQTGADLERVEVARQRYDLVYVDLKPGSAVFFHSNLLHRSDRNHSDRPRWALICCYNTRGNSPYKPGRHPQYTPLEIWEDDQILPAAERHWEDLNRHAPPITP